MFFVEIVDASDAAAVPIVTSVADVPDAFAIIEEGSSISSINLTMGWKWDVGCGCVCGYMCVKFLLPPEGARGGLEGHLMK